MRQHAARPGAAAHGEGWGGGRLRRLRVDWAAIDAVQAGELVTATVLLRAVGRGGHLVECIVTVPDHSLRGQGRCNGFVLAIGWTLPTRSIALRSSPVELQGRASRSDRGLFVTNLVATTCESK